jgi:hypothetical protein
LAGVEAMEAEARRVRIRRSVDIRDCGRLSKLLCYNRVGRVLLEDEHTT